MVYLLLFFVKKQLVKKFVKTHGREMEARDRLLACGCRFYVSLYNMVKFMYSEKATKFCEIFTLFLSVCTVDKSKVKISQNFVAFSEYMNFTILYKLT